MSIIKLQEGTYVNYKNINIVRYLYVNYRIIVRYLLLLIIIELWGLMLCKRRRKGRKVSAIHK